MLPEQPRSPPSEDVDAETPAWAAEERVPGDAMSEREKRGINWLSSELTRCQFVRPICLGWRWLVGKLHRWLDEEPQTNRFH